MTWSISIKTVGNRAFTATSSTPNNRCTGNASSPSSADFKDVISKPNNNDDSSGKKNEGGESNFVIEVDPDDVISTINDKIELVTGLRACQQRLIYRGRIINTDVSCAAGSTSDADAETGAISDNGANTVSPPNSSSPSNVTTVPSDVVPTRTFSHASDVAVASVDGALSAVSAGSGEDPETTTHANADNAVAEPVESAVTSSNTDSSSGPSTCVNGNNRTNRIHNLHDSTATIPPEEAAAIVEHIHGDEGVSATDTRSSAPDSGRDAANLEENANATNNNITGSTGISDTETDNDYSISPRRVPAVQIRHLNDSTATIPIEEAGDILAEIAEANVAAAAARAEANNNPNLDEESSREQVSSTADLPAAQAAPATETATLSTDEASANLNTSSNTTPPTHQPKELTEKKQKQTKQGVRVRDVSGLCDGQTIHLVPRALPPSPSSAPTSRGSGLEGRLGELARLGGAGEEGGSGSNIASLGGLTGLSGLGGLSALNGLGGGAGGGSSANVTSLSGADGMSLLAALLGLSGMPGSSSSIAAGGGSGGGGGAAVGSGLDGLSGLGSTAGLLGVLEDMAGEAVPSTPVGVASPSGGATTAAVAATTTTAGAASERVRDTFPRLAPLAGGRRVLRRNNRTTPRGARARASAARLTEADIRVPDPGSVEPVRQGLMTLHTLLGNAVRQMEGGVDAPMQEENAPVLDVAAELEAKEEEEEEKLEVGEGGSGMCMSRQPTSTLRSPLEANRQWYRGQWLDALDTVNQWLEATVVDIVLPSDILPNYTMSSTDAPSPRPRVRRKTRRRTPDAVVSANDLEGRRRLLLEPRPESEERGDGSGFFGLLDEGYREREDNEGVQLLLIHYNGWPHRWDEWIRSDSERIRPFRTRTKHRNTNQHASPTPQAVFQAAPATHIMDEDDEVERASLLPELERVLSSVSRVLSSATPSESRRPSQNISSSPSSDTAHLPWRFPNHGIETNISCRSDPRSHLDSSQLRQLAPLIDRLGRTLTDAAPHIAALADSLPPSVEPGFQPDGVFPTTPPGNAESPYSLLGMAERLDRGELVSPQPNSSASDANTVASTSDQDDPTMNDPDLTDFVNGMVNISRGEPRSGRDTTRDPIGSSLLASYLSSGIGSTSGSSESNDDVDNPLGRVVRLGSGGGGSFSGGGGPGIDIHIHAIVTGPGMNNLGLGGIGLGGGGVGTGGGGTATPTATALANTLPGISASSTVRAESASGNDEDMDLFSELYSESPPPLNLHGFEATSESESNDAEMAQPEVTPSDLNHFFDSINLEDSVQNVSTEELPVALDNSDQTIQDQCDTSTQEFNETVAASPENDVVDTQAESVTECNADHSQRSLSSSTSSQRENSRSPSFSNRLFRRTLGRLSNTSRRPSGNPPPLP